MLRLIVHNKLRFNPWSEEPISVSASCPSLFEFDAENPGLIDWDELRHEMFALERQGVVAKTSAGYKPMTPSFAQKVRAARLGNLTSAK